MTHLRLSSPSRVAALLLAATALGATATPASADPVRIMPVGDSITQGAGGDYTWRYQLWKELNPGGNTGLVDFVGDRTGLFNAATNKSDLNHLYADPNFDQDHHAIWARALVDEASTIGPTIKALANKPDVLLVDLGTNDAARGAAKSATALRSFIAAARAAAPGVDINVGRLYPLANAKTGAAVNASYVSGFNDAIEQAAADLDTPNQRVTVAKTDAGFNAAKLTWDGRHPTPAGEQIIADGFADALEGLGIGDGAGEFTGPVAWPWTGPAPTLASKAAGALTATWTNSVPGALAYKVERRDVTAGTTTWTQIGTIAASTLTHTQSGLVNTHTYAYRTTPVRGLMVGQPGPEVEAVVSGTATVPTPPKPAAKPWWWFW